MRVMLDDGCAPRGVCELAGAVEQEYDRTDERTAPPEEIPVYRDRPDLLKRDWYDRGKNHRVVNGRAQRELTHTGWFLGVSSLDELHRVLALSPTARVEWEPSPEKILKITWSSE